MPNIIEETKLIFADVTDNHNKVWYGLLYDNDDCETRWGRIGNALQSKIFAGAGRHFLEKKKLEKLRKGYTELKTIDTNITGSAASVIHNGKLHQIAKEQLVKSSNPILERLIKRFVDANVHRITSSTQITYNSTTGLFATPLGLVEQSGLVDARDLLAELAPLVRNRTFGTEADHILCKYLRIIPQSLGMKRFSTETLIPDENALQRQLDLIDSLESSYQALQNNSPPSISTSDSSTEQVFNVDLDILTDQPEIDRIIRWFNTSNRATHGYSRVKISTFLKIKIHDNWSNFDEKVGNIKEVWHGTGEPNLLSIFKVGLKISPPSTTVITGRLFGNGHYGSLDSSKSMQYTFGRFSGSYGTSGWLLVVDFAMGNTCYIRSYGGSKPHGYDSIWAKKENTGLRFDELIVPRDNQVRIKYLLELK